MAVIFWKGGSSTLTAHVARATFGTYDVTTTRSITLGNVVVSAADSGGNLTAALTALAVLLNASTDFYFARITWSSDATHIIGTADNAGIPIIFAGSVSGGTGTCSSAFATTTANTGPSDLSTAANYSGGVVPVAGDTLIYADNAVNCSYNLDALSAVTLAQLRIDKTYTGLIGLPLTTYATGTDGLTPSTSAYEVRPRYLKVGATLCDIGQNESGKSATGSGRINIDLTTVASTCTIYDAISSGTDANLPAIQLLANSASSVIRVRGGGGVGLAVGAGETSTIATLIGVGGSIICGPGCTFTTVTVEGATVLINGCAALTTLNVYSGTVTFNGTTAVTNTNCLGGSLFWNSSGSAGAVALQFNGTINALGSGVVFTCGTFAPIEGTLQLSPAGLSFGGSDPMTFPAPCRVVFSRS